MGHHPCDDPNRLPLGGCSSWRGCCPRPFGDSSEDAAAVPARRLPPPPGWERQEEVGRGQPGARGQRGRREAELPGTGRRCCCRWSRSNCTATSPRSFPFISPLLALAETASEGCREMGDTRELGQGNSSGDSSRGAPTAVSGIALPGSAVDTQGTAPGITSVPRHG